MSYVLWAIGVVGGAVISLVITVLLQDSVSVILIRLLRGFWSGNGHRPISGDWFTYYAVIPDDATSPSARSPSGSIEIIHLRRFGSRVTGSNIITSRDYLILGVFRDDCYLTGTWRDLSEDRYHWGGFQLWWRIDGSGMIGKFIGKDSKNHINHGIWLWARDEDRLYQLADWAASKDGGYIFDLASIRKGLDLAIRPWKEQA